MEDVNGSESAIQGYYRLLNCGFRTGLVAATDFPCNLHQPIGTQLTYVRTQDGKLSYRSWIDGIAQGRTVISRDGHREFLDLKVNARVGPGEEIAFAAKGRVEVDACWTAALPLLGRIELVRNGTVVVSRDASVAPGAPSCLHATVDFGESSWLCARRMDAKGHQLHTGAVYISVAGTPVRASSADADFFVQLIDNLIQRTSPGREWNRFFVHNLATAQDRYRRARAIYVRIGDEARARGN
jgi:hypothetical protein